MIKLIKNTYFLPKQSLLEEEGFAIIEKLKENGFDAYIVGGYIRDIILQHKPLEIDIATNAKPKEIQKLFPENIPVGEAFGVIIVKAENYHFEVATFRAEAEYKDGRHPSEVVFSNAEADAKRRDFTINSLFYDPFEHIVIDFFTGLDDLKKGVIRSIGDPEERFSEDYLRMLRAIRFSAKLDFELQADIIEAITKLASNINSISKERIFEELTKILTGRNPEKAFELLSKSGLLPKILPEIERFHNLKQPQEFHPEGDVWIHTMLMLKFMRGSTPELAWSVLLHDVGKPDTFCYRKGRESFPRHEKKGAELTEKILRRFKCSKKFIENVASIVKDHMKFAAVCEMRKSTLRHLMNKSTFNNDLELHRLDCASSHQKYNNYYFLLDKIIEFKNEPIIPPPFISGRDLLEMGFKEGPQLGIILREIQDLQLSEKLRNKTDAIKWIKNKFARMISRIEK